MPANKIPSWSVLQMSNDAILIRLTDELKRKLEAVKQAAAEPNPPMMIYAEIGCWFVKELERTAPPK
jgi:hypothetical protein